MTVRPLDFLFALYTLYLELKKLPIWKPQRVKAKSHKKSVISPAKWPGKVNTNKTECLDNNYSTPAKHRGRNWVPQTCPHQQRRLRLPSLSDRNEYPIIHFIQNLLQDWYQRRPIGSWDFKPHQQITKHLSLQCQWSTGEHELLPLPVVRDISPLSYWGDIGEGLMKSQDWHHHLPVKRSPPPQCQQRDYTGSRNYHSCPTITRSLPRGKWGTWK